VAATARAYPSAVCQRAPDRRSYVSLHRRESVRSRQELSWPITTRSSTTNDRSPQALLHSILERAFLAPFLVSTKMSIFHGCPLNDLFQLYKKRRVACLRRPTRNQPHVRSFLLMYTSLSLFDPPGDLPAESPKSAACPAIYPQLPPLLIRRNRRVSRVHSALFGIKTAGSTIRLPPDALDRRLGNAVVASTSSFIMCRHVADPETGDIGPIRLDRHQVALPQSMMSKGSSATAFAQASACSCIAVLKCLVSRAALHLHPLRYRYARPLSPFVPS